MRNPPPPIVTREDPYRRPSPGWLGVPIALVLLAGAWLAAGSAIRDSLLVPPPAAVLTELDALIRGADFVSALRATLLASGAGFLIALFLGGVVSSVFAGSLRLGTLVFLGVPAAALVPLGLLWLGRGPGVGIIGATVLAFGPMVVGFAADGAARRPAAAVGAAMALNGAVLAELVGGGRGLGYMVMESAIVLDVAKSVAAVLVLSAVGIVAVLAVHALFGVFVRDDREP